MDSPDSKIIRICYLPESSSWVNIAWKWTIYGHNLTLADLQKQYANGNIEFNGTGADTEEGRQDLLERAAIGLSTAKRGLPAPPNDHLYSDDEEEEEPTSYPKNFWSDEEDE